MSRRSKPKTHKRDWRWYASFALNGAVALSMVLGTVFLFTGGAIVPRAAPPTLLAPTAPAESSAPVAPPALTPTQQPTSPPAAPSPAPPTPTPKASASDYLFAVAGDSRNGDLVFAKLLDRVVKDGNAFFIHLGDTVPTDNEKDATHLAHASHLFGLRASHSDDLGLDLFCFRNRQSEHAISEGRLRFVGLHRNSQINRTRERTVTLLL